MHRVTPTPKEKGGDECADGWGGMSWSETGTLCPRVGSDWRSVLTEVAVRNPLGFLLSSLLLKPGRTRLEGWKRAEYVPPPLVTAGWPMGYEIFLP